MKYFIFLLFFLIACEPKPSEEMEAMGEDVLKAKTGLQITIQPLKQTP